MVCQRKFRQMAAHPSMARNLPYFSIAGTSSVYYPQSNGRANAGVKTAKRILEGNISPTTGQLDTDNACQAFLNHRNTPNKETGIASSVALYGHTLRDHLPSFAPIRREWQEIADAREVAYAKRHTRPQREGKQLTALNVGDTIQLQNQRGNNPKNGTPLAP